MHVSAMCGTHTENEAAKQMGWVLQLACTHGYLCAMVLIRARLRVPEMRESPAGSSPGGSTVNPAGFHHYY